MIVIENKCKSRYFEDNLCIYQTVPMTTIEYEVSFENIEVGKEESLVTFSFSLPPLSLSLSVNNKATTRACK